MTSNRTFTVMLVCLGNICRSPMAAAVLRRRVTDAGLAGQVAVESAGTSDWHVGEQADARAQATLIDHGYEADHSARQVAAGDGQRVDPVLAMDADNFRVLRSRLGTEEKLRMFRSFDPALAHLAPDDSRLDVPDPYYGGLDGFDDVLRMVERAADGLVAHLGATLSDGRE
jgi:protein-tyrosine phosphatase